jgi:uncharacterized membrane protein YedE/YeeE
LPVHGLQRGSPHELRWEAFDDDHEMRRHLIGACLMGVGGILAGGCTIGQGITAGSMLALSWPIAVGGMILGARIGIAILVDGSPRDLIQRNWMLLARKAPPEVVIAFSSEVDDRFASRKRVKKKRSNQNQ